MKNLSYLRYVLLLTLVVIGFSSFTEKTYAWCEWQDTFWGWTEVCYPDPPPEPPPPPPPPPEPEPPYSPPPTYNPGTGCPAFQPIGGDGGGGFGGPTSYEEAQAYVNAANSSGCGGSCTLTDTHWGYTMVCTPPPVYTTCYSGANSCGVTSAGVSVNGGACSAGTPANPAYLGQSCSATSAANACGQTTSVTGTYNCSQQCSVSAPAAPANPAYYGASCSLTSAANSCGQTTTAATGTYNCSQQCVGTPPAAPSEAGCVVPPDLTAGSVTPTTAVKDQTVTLSATVSNTGGTTGAGFTDIFQIHPNSVPATFAEISAIRTYASAAVGASSSNTMSTSYAFPSVGTWYVRACADLNASNAGSITETNEGNNCGAWTAISVSDNSLSCNVTYSDTNGNGVNNTGEPVTFSITPSTLGGSAYTYDPSESGTNITGGATLSNYTYSAGGSYEMRVTSSGYNPTICYADIAFPCAPSPTGTLSSDRSRVSQGGTVTLSWSGVAGVHTSCSITSSSGENFSISTAPSSSCSLSGGSHTSGAISSQTTYSLVCDGTTVDTEVIDIIPSIREF